MNETNQNNLWNDEPDHRNEEARVEAEHPMEAAAEAHPRQEPELHEEEASAAQAEPAEEPSYKDYYYSSGPMRTARPAQNGAPQPGVSDYGTPHQASPGYDAHGYGMPSYGTPNYGAQGYGNPYYGNPNYAAPHYDAPRAAQAPSAATVQKSGFGKKAVALALVCTLLGGAAGVGGSLLINKAQQKNAAETGSSGSSTSVQVAAPRETMELNAITVENGKLLTAAEVYRANVNSTVGITTEITTTNYWGFQSSGAAAGSGFILTEDGYILTNQHVIADANSITVAMYDGKSYPATLIGYDASNDIAVLKIEATGLTPVTLGDSDALSVGDEVLAIGNPLGELTFSLTKGNVSALNRAVTLSRDLTMNDLIQTDTAINSGNSGGALFNMYGEVVGITNAKYSSNSFGSSASIDNIGFAIPINSVRNIVSSIIEKGYISTPYIGVSVSNVSEESQSYGMPQGAAIREVAQDSPAEKAGLQVNDIVTAIDGETVSSYEDLKKHISESQPGDQMEFTVYRKGETTSVTVTVGERTTSALPETDNSQSQSSGQYGGFPWGYPSNP